MNTEDRAKKAAELFRQAAEQGDAESQYQLGLLYQQGRGVPRENDLAAQWFRKAAEQGHAEAQNKLNDLFPGKENQKQGSKQAGQPQDVPAGVSSNPESSAVQKSAATLRPGEFFFDVYESPGMAREAVKKGFSWGVCFGVFFLASFSALVMGAVFQAGYPANFLIVIMLLSATIAILAGHTADNFRGKGLQKRGYKYQGTVAARSQEDALGK